jgi:glutathione-regulated potassium-efflux system ancillary protein KefG
VTTEQRLLAEHDILILHHPFYWYSSPALLKEWLDLVLEVGFAYGQGGTALQGKSFLTVITTGGGLEAYREDGYNRFSIREFLIPFEQTATLCGMIYLPPFVAFGMHSGQRAQSLEEDAASLRQLLIALRDDELEVGDLLGHVFLNDTLNLLPNGSRDEHAR